jgi:tRNA A-37 threonylcarbamoyl transferase component Bud32
VDDSPILSGRFAGRYTIERMLGRGATATVHLAHDSVTGNEVAIKILRPDLAESIGPHRFLREIRLTQALTHPHIVPVLDSGEFEHKLYFVLPLMEGGSLRDKLNREPQLPVSVAVEIAITIAGALGYAHKAGVIHRDVKPENILLSGDSVCLADFGIARAIERAIDESSTSTGIVRGTPAYMSPEQASGQHDYDGRSDIFSLGCVLYEMIAGIHAFVGPTAQAVMAQRLMHPPRPISVYRPSVSPGIEAVLKRALEVLPIDRFKTAGEFSDALAASIREGSRTAIGPREWLTRNRRRVMTASLATVAVLGLGMAAWRPWEPGKAFGALIDTTRIMVLPVEGDSSAPRKLAYDLLQQGFASWRGVNVLDEVAMRDARGSDLPVRSSDEARYAAGSGGAGKYVRTQLTHSGRQLRLWSGIFDTRTGAKLHEATTNLDPSMAAAPTAIDGIVAELLLHRRNAAGAGSRVLGAVTQLDSAMVAVEAFSLNEADSLLMASLELDPGYARAALWLAQVRNWSLEPTSAWMTWVERSVDGTGLTQRESHLARALVAIGKGEFPQACAIYDTLRANNERDFASWYGLGQCHRLDDVVLRDSRTVSGWRFRSSSHQAALAYARAFALAPALHKNFESRAYSDVRDLLYSRRSFLRRGSALPPERLQFLAYASLEGDTIVHVPFPREMITRGLVGTNPAGRAAVLEKQRGVFSTLAHAWAASLPRSPATKEALAVSLEMVGDERAVDTLRAARRLARDPSLRLRLAAEEVFIRISFARRDANHADAARALADSLLAGARSPSREDASILAPVAAVTGKCRLAARLAARSVSEATAAYFEKPLPVVAAAESLTVLSAMGCRPPGDTTGVQSVMSTVTAGENRDSVEYALLGRAAILTYPLDRLRVARLADVSGDYVLVVQSASLAGNGRVVRKELGEKHLIRPAADVTPDAMYPEARAWLAIGDRKKAVEWLDPVLVRRGWLELMLNDAINAASLLRSIALRVEVAVAMNDPRAASQWATIISRLWMNPDDELKPLSRRMAAIAAK